MESPTDARTVRTCLPCSQMVLHQLAVFRRFWCQQRGIQQGTRTHRLLSEYNSLLTV
jgi:hypothetical protein